VSEVVRLANTVSHVPDSNTRASILYSPVTTVFVDAGIHVCVSDLLLADVSRRTNGPVV
jgi:hypothetical protein